MHADQSLMRLSVDGGACARVARQKRQHARAGVAARRERAARAQYRRGPDALAIWVNIAALNLEGLGSLVGYASERHGEAAASLTTRRLGDGGGADHPAIAEALRTDFALAPGTPVAFVGYSYSAYWARLARLRIVAEVRPEEIAGFWRAGQDVREEIFAAFAATGAKAVVSEPPSIGAVTEGWDAVRGTGYLHRRLR